MSMDVGLLLVAHRARIISRSCQLNHSGMVACHLSLKAVQDILNSSDVLGQLTVVCINSPNDVVVAGPLDSLHKLITVCQSMNVKATKLDVPMGFHSSAMDPILDEFRNQLSSVKLGYPVLPLGSSLYGRSFSLGEKIPVDYFAQQARQPIEFCKLAENIAQNHPKEKLVFLEIGPSPTSK